MAVQILKDVTVSIGGVQLETNAQSVTLNYEVESIDVTAFDGSGARKFAGGLQNNSCEVTLMQNFASAQTEATVYPLVGTITNVILKPATGTISATLPQYTLTGAYLAAHTPVAGGVGELATTTLSFTGGVLTKIVTPPSP
jgi:predicted secreted protein